MNRATFQAIVIGASMGGVKALDYLLPILSSSCSLPILVVQHISASHDVVYADYLSQLNMQHHVCEARPNQCISPQTIYVAPADYHVLVEQGGYLALSKDWPVHHSRPSIDVLFKSAADVYQQQLIGILLTGANQDGAEGISYIYDLGGISIIQNPSDAACPVMPESAIQSKKFNAVLNLKDIAFYLTDTLGLLKA